MFNLTLVASLLLTSAFSVYSVDAKPVLATPTQVETRAVSADVEEAKVAYAAIPDFATIETALETHILPGFTNNALMYCVNPTNTNLDGLIQFNISSTPNDINAVAYSGYTSATPETFYWTLRNGQLVDNGGHVLAVNGVSTYFEVIPLLQPRTLEPTPYFALATRANGVLEYVVYNGSVFKLESAGRNESVPQTAAIFASIEPQYNVAMSPNQLNDVLGNGFNLFISSMVDEDATIIDADKFAGLLTPADLSSSAARYTRLQNADDKYIVFEKDTRITSDGVAELGEFKLVDTPNASTQKAYFHVSQADNGSGDIIVRVADNVSGANPTRLYIANTRGTFALSVANETRTGLAPLDAKNWAVTSLDGGNMVELKEFLTGQFYTVDFVEAATPSDANAYKYGGRLAVKDIVNGADDKSDYVDAKSLYEKAPEAQWAVTAYSTTDVNNIQGIKLTNREDPRATVTITGLRRSPKGLEVTGVHRTSTNTGVEVGDIILMNAVTEHSKNDGYAVFSANDLRNETYHLGQVRQTADGDVNVYWAENHGTHQIGATVEEANASRWNLSLVTKPVAKHTSEIDSVLVVSELQDWNEAKNRIDSKKDTLVILPYAFQNRSNNEFVKMNDQTNLEYYICDKDNKDNAVETVYQADGETVDYIGRLAQRFALKMKADGTYNFIALRDQKTTQYSGKDDAVVTIANSVSEYIDDKVYQENSTDRGTWREMEAYAGDANALMFVTKVDAPEYRKLVTEAALDTIKLYRADNEAQVVYEKRNDDAIVNGKALSFLNIDNDAQFTEINPALYADTAYVNRGNNTRWQYLLGVNIEHKEGYYCPEHGFGETEPCQHAEWVSYNEGRYLINMIDTANVYGANVNIHNNPYINETEEGNQCAKLSFVDAIHVLTDNVDPTKADKLYVINGAESRDKYTVVDLSTADFNVAKFAFKYTDSMTSDEFKIQTQWKAYDPATYGTAAYNNNAANFSEEGYLRWVNGCIVVDKTYQKGDVFNMDENETRTPTANEAIEDATSAISVVATEGGVIVKGAEGKNVIVSTILGKVVANETVTSDNVTIAAPAGIVVVSVDGESFKVAVK